MRERREHERGVPLGRSRHEVGELVGDHESHLVVGQDGGLRAAARAGGEEVPGGIADLDVRVRYAVAGTVERGDLADRICAAAGDPQGAPAQGVDRLGDGGGVVALARRGRTAAAGRQTLAITVTSDGVSRQFVGARIAPMRQVANMAWTSSTWLALCSSTQSPARTPRAVSSRASALTPASSCRQVHRRSPWTIASWSGSRRAVWVSRVARLTARLVALIGSPPTRMRSWRQPRRPC